MQRRTACRLIAGFLLAGFGCGRSSSTKPEEVEFSPQRFPKAGRDKKVEPKGNLPAKKGE